MSLLRMRMRKSTSALIVADVPRVMAKKEILVVFGDRRRPIIFEPCESEKEERARLIEAVRTAFSDLLGPQSQPSEDSKQDVLPGMYLLRESEKWGDQLVEVLESIEDSAVLQLCKYDSRF